jgi:hypothetical protein
MIYTVDGVVGRIAIVSVQRMVRVTGAKIMTKIGTVRNVRCVRS